MPLLRTLKKRKATNNLRQLIKVLSMKRLLSKVAKKALLKRLSQLKAIKTH
jgi:hypothetical protein